MANEYLVNIHHFLSEKIKESEAAVRSAVDKGDMAKQQYYSGELYELTQIRKYMSENFNLETQVYY
jgi:hypothetical protein